jgi:hypothetical protein
VWLADTRSGHYFMQLITTQEDYAAGTIWLGGLRERYDQIVGGFDPKYGDG